MEILLIGETPAKKNSVKFNARTHTTYKTEHYRLWYDNAVLQIRSIYHKLGITKPIEKCEIEITFTHGDYRRRDSDNGTSSILDILVDTGILLDDNWQVVRKITVKNQFKKNVPSCLINIILLDNI